jgi:threonine dehydratase
MTLRLKDVQAAAARIQQQRGAHPAGPLPHPLAHHRRGGVPEIREPPVHRCLQGARRAEPIAHPHRRAAAARGVIAMSAGNHAQGVAYHARRLGIPAVIVMPRHTPNVKVEHTRSHGAEVLLHGDSFDETDTFTRRPGPPARADAGASLRRPAGHGRPGHAGPGDAGAGAHARHAGGAHRRRRPDRRRRHGGPRAQAGPGRGRRPVRALSPPCTRSCCGTSPSSAPATPWPRASRSAIPGRRTLPIIKRAGARTSCWWARASWRTPSCCCSRWRRRWWRGRAPPGWPRCCSRSKQFRKRRVGLLLCGGNIDLMILSSIIQRGLARGGQLARVRVETRDVPGELARVSGLIGTQRRKYRGGAPPARLQHPPAADGHGGLHPADARPGAPAGDHGRPAWRRLSRLAARPRWTLSAPARRPPSAAGWPWSAGTSWP